MKNGDSQSCGCLLSEQTTIRSTKHGLAGHYLYKTWYNMIQRCENPKSTGYNNYGGRGIKVCERWREENGLQNFIQDMGERPNGTTLDRYPNKNGNYEPENCRWATQEQQSRNKNQTINITYNGKTQCLTDWARELNLPELLLWQRIRKLKWTVEKAFTTQIEEYDYLIFNFNGELKTLSEFSQKYNIKYTTLYNRIFRDGLDIEEALTIPIGEVNKIDYDSIELTGKYLERYKVAFPDDKIC